LIGARVLGEFGDDHQRFADAKARKRYAGTAPITVASGKKIVVRARLRSNRHLADACYWWAFCALSQSPGARTLYDTRRAKGDSHDQALRALGNRLVGILHGCLRSHTPTTKPPPGPTPQPARPDHPNLTTNRVGRLDAGRRAWHPPSTGPEREALSSGLVPSSEMSLVVGRTNPTTTRTRLAGRGEPGWPRPVGPCSWLRALMLTIRSPTWCPVLSSAVSTPAELHNAGGEGCAM
jgi:transposase IS116/IS110/IS902 family protein